MTVMQLPAVPVPTAQQRAKAAENLRKAKVQLVISQPFFSSITLKRKIDVREDVPTAYVTNTGKIVFGLGFLASLTVQETMFVLAHEAMHFAMQHGLRRGYREPRPWNIACDWVINALLKLNNVGTPPKNGAYRDGAEKFAAEQLYEEAKQQQDGQGQGQGQGPYQPGTGLDDLQDGEQLSDAEEQQILEGIKRELLQAGQAAKSVGAMPVGMEDLIDKIVNPPTPWYQILRQHMMLMVKSDLTWSRPNKRLINLGIYMPTHDKKPKMGTVVIQIDESGSIGPNETSHFFGHIVSIVENCQPEKIILLHTDTRVAMVEELEVNDFPFDYKTYAGGGTDMVAGIRWVEENGVVPDAFITLTDGYSPWPDSEPGFPTFWLITSDVQCPVGMTIHYDMN